MKSSEECRPTDHLDERRPARRRIIGGLLLMVVGVALAVVYWRSRQTIPQPPHVELQDSHSLVAAAIDEARQAVAADPRSAAAWGSYGMCLYAHGFTDAALQAFAQAEALDEDDYRWPYLSGLAVTFTDPERGRRCFERASRLRPGAVFVRLRTAELLLDLNLAEEAAGHIEAALNLEPQNPRALLAAAQLAFLRGDLPRSRTLAAQALQLVPTVSAAVELLARICFQLGDEQAAREYQRQVRPDGAGGTNWPDPLYAQVMQRRQDPTWLLAQIQRQGDSGQTATAVAQLQRALDREPHLLEFRIELIQTLLQQGVSDQAERLLERGLQLHPASARLHRLRGVFYFQQAEYERAAQEFRSAIQLKDDYALAYVNLGECLSETGDRPAALEALQRAHSLQPDLPGLADRIAQLRGEDASPPTE